jgi:hypothetical protein
MVEKVHTTATNRATKVISLIGGTMDIAKAAWTDPPAAMKVQNKFHF